MPFPVARPAIRDTIARRLFAPLLAERRELAAFAYLDPEWRLLGMRHVRSCIADAVEVPVRRIAADAIAFYAAGLVIAHTHLRGDCTPSAADIAITRGLLRAMEALEVRLPDIWCWPGTAMRALLN